MVSEAFKPRARFSKAIYIIAKYCIDIMIDLVSRAKHLLAFPSLKLSFWWFLKIILAYFDPKVGIVFSKIYWLSTWYKSIAKPTAQNFETLNCRKIDDGNPNNSANTDIYAYSETTWVYCRLWNDRKLNLCVLPILEDVSDTHYMDTKK